MLITESKLKNLIRQLLKETDEKSISKPGKDYSLEPPIPPAKPWGQDYVKLVARRKPYLLSEFTIIFNKRGLSDRLNRFYNNPEKEEIWEELVDPDEGYLSGSGVGRNWDWLSVQGAHAKFLLESYTDPFNNPDQLPIYTNDKRLHNDLEITYQLDQDIFGDFHGEARTIFGVEIRSKKLGGNILSAWDFSDVELEDEMTPASWSDHPFGSKLNLSDNEVLEDKISLGNSRKEDKLLDNDITAQAHPEFTKSIKSEHNDPYLQAWDYCILKQLALIKIIQWYQSCVWLKDPYNYEVHRSDYGQVSEHDKEYTPSSEFWLENFTQNPHEYEEHKTFNIKPYGGSESTPGTPPSPISTQIPRRPPRESNPGTPPSHISTQTRRTRGPKRPPFKS